LDNYPILELSGTAEELEDPVETDRMFLRLDPEQAFVEEFDAFIDALSKDCVIKERPQDGEWAALALKRPCC